MKANKTVPLIVASALIMQQLDSTAVATALPSIAEELNQPAVTLHSAITIYLLAAGVFLPLSGWLADRLGARMLFCWAIGIFTVASLLCAASNSILMLTAARALQGFGGALMVPTARLILVRSVSREELVPAMVLMSMPSVIGPAMGPLLGGMITSVSSWRWIFWINLPIGVAAIVLSILLVKEVPPRERTSFDLTGFALTGVGIGLVIFGLDSISKDAGAPAIAMAACGLSLLLLYVFYARRKPDAILDLSLFRHPTFRISVTGGSLFRAMTGAVPFMLPLLMQEIFHYGPLQSGAITFTTAIGAFGMRTITKRILKRYGFRKVLLWNAVIASLSISLCATFTAQTAPAIMVAIILLGGFFRSLQAVSLSTLSFAEISDAEMSHATSLSQMAQRISQSIGVAIAALLLQFFSGGADALTNDAFMMSFIAVGLISASSSISFASLKRDAGDDLTGRKVATPGPGPEKVDLDVSR